MVDEASPDQQAVIQKYKQLESQCRQFVTKISELEVRKSSKSPFPPPFLPPLIREGQFLEDNVTYEDKDN